MLVDSFIYELRKIAEAYPDRRRRQRPSGPRTEDAALMGAAGGLGVAGASRVGLGALASRFQDAPGMNRHSPEAQETIQKALDAAKNPEVVSYGGAGGAGGFYSPKDHKVHVSDDLGTMLHELGHAKDRGGLWTKNMGHHYQTWLNPKSILGDDRVWQYGAPVALGAGAAAAMTSDDPQTRALALGGLAAASTYPAFKSFATLGEETRAWLNAQKFLRDAPEAVRKGARSIHNSQLVYTGKHLPRLLAPLALGGLAYREATKTAAMSDKKKAKASSMRWTPKAIHKLADHLGVKWDNDPQFMRLCYGLTGKKHLDQMDSTELAKVAKTLVKRFRNRVPAK